MASPVLPSPAEASHFQRNRPIYPPRRPFGGPRQDSRDFGPRINDRIRISPVRLLDPEGEMLGVVELDEAKRRAYEMNLDLVEISPDSRPPVCKIMDFGKFKYEQSKKEKANKAKSKASEMKEVRLGRSMKIDPHDVDIRVAQARRFLIEGHRVQIVQNFRGREMAFRQKGDDRMEDIIERLSDLAKVEVPPRMNGRRMGMILVPEKQKVEAYKRKMTAEGKPILPTIPEQLEHMHDDDHDDDDDLALNEEGGE
ncbi:MAG: translation initiation factor IF-3 [Limnohabitans sp.]|nr:translation initiation factor IF-3 [Limnohabitans sp.]